MLGTAALSETCLHDYQVDVRYVEGNMTVRRPNTSTNAHGTQEHAMLNLLL